MTKKTNSLLFRLGISTIWKNKSVKYQSITNRIQIENIILQEFKKRKLKVLYMNYLKKKISIYFYNGVYTDTTFKKKIIKYHKKKLDLQNTSENFGIKLKKLRAILTFSKKIKTNKSIYFTSKLKIKKLKRAHKNKKPQIFSIYFKVYILKILFTQITKLKWTLTFQFWRILNIFFKNKGIFFPINSRLISKIKYINQLKKTKGQILENLISSKLENIIFWKCLHLFEIEMLPIFSKIGLYIGNIKKYSLKQYNIRIFRESYCSLILALNYKKSDVLVQELCIALKKNKKHWLVLRQFVNRLQTYYNSRHFKIRGLQLRANGKLGGKMRKSKYHFKLGKVQLQTLKIQTTYSIGYSYTRFGIISLKIWVLYAKTFI